MLPPPEKSAVPVTLILSLLAPLMRTNSLPPDCNNRLLANVPIPFTLPPPAIVTLPATFPLSVNVCGEPTIKPPPPVTPVTSNFPALPTTIVDDVAMLLFEVVNSANVPPLTAVVPV